MNCQVLSGMSTLVLRGLAAIAAALALILSAIGGPGADPYLAALPAYADGAEPQLVKPAELDPLAWGSARCNDGTPFGFVVEPSAGGSRDWVIYLEGGGFCDDAAMDCSKRSTRMTSTPGDDALEIYAMARTKAVLSDDPDFNPSFYDANRVWAFYCSSDVWSGDTVQRRPTRGDPEQGWYFSGRANVRAMFEALIAGWGLDDADPATRVLYAGGSAGGEGVQASADVVCKLLPATARSGRLKLVNDTGSVFVFDHPDYRFGGTGLTFKQVMVQAYDFWGSRLNPLCERAQRAAGRSPAECLDEAVVVPYIVESRPEGLGLPMLVQHSSIDGFQLKMHGIFDPEGTAIFRANTLSRFGEIPFTWLFSSGDRVYHCVTIRNDRWQMGPPGSTFQEVLTRFWDRGPPEIVIFGNP